ncbi:MAG: ABC transporter substrate-binding protein [Actinomycetota bacterium]|nr:ABC transporter substrate-binding protein [Actinomycetota bacterium]
MQRQRASALALLIAGVFLATACTPTDTDAQDGPVVTVFGGYKGVEAERFADSMASFEEQTGIAVRYVGAGSFSKAMEDRAANADFPDIALFPQPGLLTEYAHRGLLLPLDEETQATVAMHPETAAGTVGDVPYSVWFRASVKSLVWYEPQIFAERGYSVPSTWDEMIDLTSQMEIDGFTPWCLSVESFGATGWVATDWIEDIVLRQNGADVYDQWVAADISFEDDRIIAALETFGEIVHHPGRVLGGTHRILNTPWTQAQDPMFESPPRCLLNRQGSVQQAQLPSRVTIGTETDVFVLPSMDGGEPPILAAGEFAAAFTDRPEVHALMQYLATPEAGEAWAGEGGFVSPHVSFDADAYGDDLDRHMADVLSQANVVRLDGSDSMHPSVGTGTFWTGMVSYIREGNARGVAAEIQAGYPEVTHFPEVPVSEG